MIEVGDYGQVEIIKGKHKGKIGYYDNEESDKCVVYLNEVPFQENSWLELSPGSLKRIPATKKLKAFCAKHKPFCKQIDIRAE